MNSWTTLFTFEPVIHCANIAIIDDNHLVYSQRLVEPRHRLSIYFYPNSGSVFVADTIMENPNTIMENILQQQQSQLARIQAQYVDRPGFRLCAPISLFVDDAMEGIVGPELKRRLQQVDDACYEYPEAIHHLHNTPKEKWGMGIYKDYCRALGILDKLQMRYEDFHHHYNRGRPRTFFDEVEYCRAWAFGARLYFYIALYEQWPVDKLEKAILSLTGEEAKYQATSAHILRRLRDVLWFINRRLDRLRFPPVDIFDDSVRLVPITPIPDLQAISTAVAPTTTYPSCTICMEQVDESTGVKLNSCGHYFCEDCIKHWCGGCRPTSHQCPNCKRDIFPAPKYTLHPEDRARIESEYTNLAMDNHEEIDYLRRQQRTIDQTIHSLFLLEIEMRQTVYPDEQNLVKSLLGGGVAQYILTTGRDLPYHPLIARELADGKIEHWEESRHWGHAPQDELDPRLISVDDPLFYVRARPQNN